jgi:hypothetical protein
MAKGELLMDPISIINLITDVAPAVTSLLADVEGLFGSTATPEQKTQIAASALGTALQGAVTGAQAVGATNVTNTIAAITPALPSIVGLFAAAISAVGNLGNSAKAATVPAATPAVKAAPSVIPGFPTAS